mmetsp:Transcript_7385/g.17741  ORF Transcript_7385/g.17741 Transcript_7385/m.17741 type:complete len:332 (+) Transcript_7385:1963-2958(+)
MPVNLPPSLGGHQQHASSVGGHHQAGKLREVMRRRRRRRKRERAEDAEEHRVAGLERRAPLGEALHLDEEELVAGHVGRQEAVPQEAAASLGCAATKAVQDLVLLVAPAVLADADPDAEPVVLPDVVIHRRLLRREGPRKANEDASPLGRRGLRGSRRPELLDGLLDRRPELLPRLPLHRRAGSLLLEDRVEDVGDPGAGGQGREAEDRLQPALGDEVAAPRGRVEELSLPLRHKLRRLGAELLGKQRGQEARGDPPARADDVLCALPREQRHSCREKQSVSFALGVHDDGDRVGCAGVEADALRRARSAFPVLSGEAKVVLEQERSLPVL